MSESLYWIRNRATGDLAVMIPFSKEWRALAIAEALTSESQVGNTYDVIEDNHEQE